MKKTVDNELKILISKDVDEIFAILQEHTVWKQDHPEGEFPYPYKRELLKLLHTANPLELTYYYVEQTGGQTDIQPGEQENDQTERYAFFTSYLNRMDLLTFGKAQWFMNVHTIGFPCSLSVPGYVTNDMAWMFGIIKKIKGAKLILNCDRQEKIAGMACGETLPTCKLTLRPEHTSIGNYLASLRSSYRRRMKLACKRCGDITIHRDTEGNLYDIYPLYLQTYEKSEYKLECLSREFFEQVDGEKLVFVKDERPVGFVLLKINGTELIFMFCGMDYSYERNADLYYYMLLQIVDYAMTHHLKTIDFGQTSEKTKLKFGAVTETKYFYAQHTNPILNLVALLGRHILEYKYEFPEYRVFREEADMESVNI